MNNNLKSVHLGQLARQAAQLIIHVLPPKDIFSNSTVLQTCFPNLWYRIESELYWFRFTALHLSFLSMMSSYPSSISTYTARYMISTAIHLTFYEKGLSEKEVQGIAHHLSEEIEYYFVHLQLHTLPSPYLNDLEIKRRFVDRISIKLTKEEVHYDPNIQAFIELAIENILKQVKHILYQLIENIIIMEFQTTFLE
ncbi:hypothetical protein [Paenibacillus kyungheensis]